MYKGEQFNDLGPAVEHVYKPSAIGVAFAELDVKKYFDPFPDSK